MRNPQAFKDLSALKPETFEQDIIDYLLSEPELGETLKAAGRTRKGMSPELLSKIRGVSDKDAKAALEALKERVFAKTFPDDNERVFLHDELYDLLNTYVYKDAADAADRQAAAQAIIEYYRDEIGKKNEELKNIFASLTAEKPEQSVLSSEDYVPKIRELESKRQQLKTEFVHYRLRYQVEKAGKRKAHEDDPIFAGLKMYYRYGHEAATSNNDEILIPLQIELTNFWLSLKDGDFWKPFIEGLLLIHEIWLRLATAQNYWDAIPDLENSLSRIVNLSNDQEVILHALLKTWLGTGLVFAKQPDYERAENLFASAIETLQKLQKDQSLGWFKDVVVSLAYRQRAYLHRIRGTFQNAIKDFRAGLHYSRSINFIHEEATLRNDLGFSQMHIGLFLPALEDMQDGLQLRYKIAIGPRIALSHSSLAQFYIATGVYEEARKHALSAIQISEISERVGFWRGQAFGHLAFAEATRRYAFSFLDISSQTKYLQEAHEAITVAIERFEGLSEVSRIIDSKLEEACIYRDRTRVETDPSKKRVWFDKSAKQLLEVAQEAQKAGIFYRHVDAMCNRVWLGYFSGDIDYALQSATDFENLEILTPYWIKNGQYVDEKKAEAEPVLWSYVGKYCMARGIISLDTWMRRKDDMVLAEAARYFTLSMTYSTKFALDHRGLREGRRRIFEALKRLNHNELKQFCNHVLEAIKTEKISQTPSELQTFMEHHALWSA
jgi:tetratricopeptide (TPR) repeat protein